MARRSVTLQLDLQSRGAQQSVDRLQRKFGTLDKKGTQATQKINKGVGRMSGLLKAGVSAFAAGAVVNQLQKMATAAFESATAIEETANKFETVFGGAVQRVNGFIEENAQLMGLTNQEAQNLISRTGQVAQGLGFSAEASADFSTEIAGLAGDLASFNNMPTERVLNAINSALTGEREQLKQLGIVIQETDVQQRAFNNTGKESADALTDQERATATLQLITEKAGVAVGDLARTQDSTANQARQLGAQWRQLTDELSKGLLPAFGQGISVATSFLDVINDLMSTPYSEKLKDQRNELNLLVGQLSATNVSEERRNKLISQLNDTMPSFVEQIDAEAASTQELNEWLEKVNQAYAQRIVAQQQAEKVSQAVEEQGNALTRAQENLASANELANRANREYNLGLDLTNMTMQQQVEAVRNALQGQAAFIDGQRGAREAANQEAQALQSLNEYFANYTQANGKAERAGEALQEQQQRSRNILMNLGFSLDEINQILNDGTRALDETEDKQDKKNKTDEQAVTTSQRLKQTQEDLNEAIRDFTGSDEEIERIEKLREQKDQLTEQLETIKQIQQLQRSRRMRGEETAIAGQRQGVDGQTLGTGFAGGGEIESGLGTNQLNLRKVKEVETGYESAAEMARKLHDQNLLTADAMSALESVGTRFVDSFGQGMANVIVQGENLQNVLENIGKLLLSSVIQTGIRLLLAQATGGASEGGGIVSALVGGIAGNARGTDNFGGGLTRVGERGEELVALPPQSSILNNANVERMDRMRRDAGQAVNNITQTFDYSQMQAAMRQALGEVEIQGNPVVQGEDIALNLKMVRKRALSSGEDDPINPN